MPAPIRFLERVSKYGWTPLHYACYRGAVNTVQLLLDVGLSPELFAQMGSLLQPCAAVRRFAAASSDVCAHVADAERLTALHLACANARLEVVRLLLPFTPFLEAEVRRAVPELHPR